MKGIALSGLSLTLASIKIWTISQQWMITYLRGVRWLNDERYRLHLQEERMIKPAIVKVFGMEVWIDDTLEKDAWELRWLE